jgi:hypothetical protein
MQNTKEHRKDKIIIKKDMQKSVKEVAEKICTTGCSV